MASASDRRPPWPDDRGSLQPDVRLLTVATVCLLAVLALSAVGPTMSGGPGGGSGGGVSTPFLEALIEHVPVEWLGDLAGVFDGLPDGFLTELLEALDPNTIREIGQVLADVIPLLDGGGSGSGSGDGGSNQLLELALGALAVAIVVAVIAAILWRWGDVFWSAGRRAGGRLASVLRALPSLLVDLAVRTGRALEDAAGRLAAAARQLVLEPVGTIRAAVVGLPGALRALTGRILATILALLVAVLPDRLVAWLRRVVLGEEPDEPGDAASVVGAADRDDEADGRSVLDLQALWRAFVAAVRPPNLSTKTPGEVGRYAVDRGFPSAPTRTIVDTYRAAEYGDRRPSDGRLERVLDAVREIAGDDAPDGEFGETVGVGDGPAGDGLDAATSAESAAGGGTRETAAETETAEDGAEVEAARDVEEVDTAEDPEEVEAARDVEEVDTADEGEDGETERGGDGA